MKVIFANPPVDALPDAASAPSECIFQSTGVPGKHIGFPVQMAEAATLLRRQRFTVGWKDAVVEKLDYHGFTDYILDFKPDVVAIRSTMPLIKRHSRIIADLKKALPCTKFVLMGIDISAVPEQSLQFSGADYVVAGADYDFLLLNLCAHLRDNIQLDDNIWRCENDHVVGTKSVAQERDLASVPVIDRQLTSWESYSGRGGFLYHPGACIMAARGCAYTECRFCPAGNIYDSYRTKSPERVQQEIVELFERYGVQEIIDCSYTFPEGEWLHRFCGAMISSGYNSKIKIGCSIRPGAVHRDEYNLMLEAGFRTLSFGLASANRKTLQRLQFQLSFDQTIESIADAKEAGLSPAVTAVVGYPWETYSDAKNTARRTRALFEKGLADVVRGRVLIPYPGMPFYSQAVQHGWINGDEWQCLADYPARDLPGLYPRLIKLVHRLEWLQKTPLYFIRRIAGIRTTEDLKSISREMKGAVTPKTQRGPRQKLPS